MKLRYMLRTLALSMCAFLSIMCGAAIYYEAVTPWADLPFTAIDVGHNSYCGSGSCIYTSAYDIATAHTVVLDFYQTKGYRCEEIHTTSDAGLFPSLAKPYWQCRGNAFPKGNAYVGFEVREQTTTHQSLRIVIFVAWDPLV